MSSAEYARLYTPNVLSSFEATPEEGRSLLEGIIALLREAGLYRRDLLFSGFSVDKRDDSDRPAPSMIYVMSEDDWRQSLTAGDALVPPMYAELAGDRPAIAVIDSSKVVRNDGGSVTKSTFNIPVVPGPGYADIDAATLAIIILSRDGAQNP